MRCLTIDKDLAFSPFFVSLNSSLCFLAPEVPPAFPAVRVLSAVGPHQQFSFRPRFSLFCSQASLTGPVLQGSSCKRSFYCIKAHSWRPQGRKGQALGCNVQVCSAYSSCRRPQHTLLWMSLTYTEGCMWGTQRDQQNFLYCDNCAGFSFQGQWFSFDVLASTEGGSFSQTPLQCSARG